MTPLLAGALAAAVTAATTPLVIRLARRTDVMDHPGPLKPHEAPVPYLGGLAVLAGTVVGLIASPHLGVLLAACGALLLGVVDDITSLAVLPRFLAEIAVGAAVVWSTGADGWLLRTAVLVGTIVMINGVNFIDGLDALASSVACISFLGFALVLPTGWVQTAAALAGAAAGFLVFNRPPARIYLGDAGSYLLGTALAVLAGAYLAQPQALATSGRAGDASPPDLFGTGVTVTGVAVVLALMAYPAIEVISTVARRLLSRRPIFAGDRDHVYDRLVQSGRSRPVTVAVIAAAQVVFVGVGLVTHAADSTALAVVVIALVVGVTALAATPRALAPR